MAFFEMKIVNNCIK